MENGKFISNKLRKAQANISSQVRIKTDTKEDLDYAFSDSLDNTSLPVEIFNSIVRVNYFKENNQIKLKVKSLYSKIDIYDINFISKEQNLLDQLIGDFKIEHYNEIKTNNKNIVLIPSDEGFSITTVLSNQYYFSFSKIKYRLVSDVEYLDGCVVFKYEGEDLLIDFLSKSDTIFLYRKMKHFSKKEF